MSRSAQATAECGVGEGSPRQGQVEVRLSPPSIRAQWSLRWCQPRVLSKPWAASGVKRAVKTGFVEGGPSPRTLFTQRSCRRRPSPQRRRIRDSPHNVVRSSQIGGTSSEFCTSSNPISTDFGPSSNVASFRSTSTRFGRLSNQHGLTQARVWRSSTGCGPTQSRFGPISADVGQSVTAFDQTWVGLRGQRRSKHTKRRPRNTRFILPRVESDQGRVRPTLGGFDQIWYGKTQLSRQLVCCHPPVRHNRERFLCRGPRRCAT